VGNSLAYIVMALWPLIALYLYKNKSIQDATLWVIIGGLMFLPAKSAIDLPFFPALGKDSIPVISALIGCWVIKNKRISYITGLGKLKYLAILFVTVPFITAGLNSDLVNIGGHILPGLTYYDGLSATINQFIIIIPFFIGRQFFRTYEHQLILFKMLVMAGLLYSLPIFFEVRMSPQLHAWIYGYSPSDFNQQIRLGGFRPVVFMGHGLLVSFFSAIVLLASVALWSNKTKVRGFIPAWVSYYLLFVLLLCKSVAPFLYGMLGFFVVKILSPKVQIRIAVMLVSLTMLYPVMSILKVFPHQSMVDVAESISPERAQSLEFRFNHEGMLLDKANERIFFGWGGWGRNRVYDDETGRDLSVTDGRWILILGQFGLFGFIAEFGMLAITVFRAKNASVFLQGKSEKRLFVAHALLIAVIMVDQLPNASLGPWLWLLAGVLLGRSEKILAQYVQKNDKQEFDSAK
jgi:hypothetical protein